MRPLVLVVVQAVVVAGLAAPRGLQLLGKAMRVQQQTAQTQVAAAAQAQQVALQAREHLEMVALAFLTLLQAHL
jgi:hypothetical protein